MPRYLEQDPIHRVVDAGCPEELAHGLLCPLARGGHAVFGRGRRATPDDAPLWYYARLYGIPDHHFSGKQPYQRLLVIVNTSLGQTPQSVLTERAPNVTCTPTAEDVLLTREFYTVYLCPLP